MLMNTKVSKEAPSNRYKAIEEGASLLYFFVYPIDILWGMLYYIVVERY